jgi:hypothetical protein
VALALSPPTLCGSLTLKEEKNIKGASNNVMKIFRPKRG